VDFLLNNGTFFFDFIKLGTELAELSLSDEDLYKKFYIISCEKLESDYSLLSKL
jgi:hypothetical protein